MKSKIALLATIALASTAALAGYYQPATVEVNFADNGSGDGFAGGDMTTAANSNNDVEFIGCGTRTFFNEFTGVTFISGFCQVSDADGNRAVCRTNSPILIDAMRSIDGRSYITFSWVNIALPEEEPVLRCTRVGHSTQSFYLDKIKPSNNDNRKEK